jgi:hypothetical protein
MIRLGRTSTSPRMIVYALFRYNPATTIFMLRFYVEKTLA